MIEQDNERFNLIDGEEANIQYTGDTLEEALKKAIINTNNLPTHNKLVLKNCLYVHFLKSNTDR